MNIRAFCHRCGADIERDTPIRIDEFSMLGDGYPLMYGDCELNLTRSEATLAWALLKAYPDFVRCDTLLERMDSNATSYVVPVMVCRLRRHIRTAGGHDAIENVRGRGYRWRPLNGHVPLREICFDGDIGAALTALYGPAT